MNETATIKGLRERRAGLWKQMTDIIVASEKKAAAPGEQNEGQPLISAEDRGRYEALEQELDALTADIETRSRHEIMSAKLNAPQGAASAAFGNPADASGDPKAAYTEAFTAYMRSGLAEMPVEQRSLLRSGYSELSAAERRDLGVGTGAAGGFMVPQGFLLKITEALKYYGPMRSVANVIQTSSGQPLPWPGNDDTANVGAILGENVQITTQDVVITQQTLNAYMYTSLLVKVSWQLLNDDAFDVETFLARKLGQRIGRIQNTHFTTGTGSSQPLGLIPGLQAGANKHFTLPSGNTTSLTYAGLVSTVHSINFAYRQKFTPTQGPANLSTEGGPGSVGAGNTVGWQMNDLTLAAVRQLVDSQNRPLWQLAVGLNDPDTLLGYPVFVNPDIAVMAANAVCATFGCYDAAYLIRDVAGVQMVRLDERYADQLQAGFFAFCRTDAKTDDTNAVGLLINSAT